MIAPVVRHVGCPSCGGTLVRPADERIVECPHCGNRCVLLDGDAACRQTVLPRVSKERAISIVRAALAKWPVREGAAEDAGVVGAECLLVPYHEFEAIQAGTVVRKKGTRTAQRGRTEWTGRRKVFYDEGGIEISVVEWRALQEQDEVDTCVVLRTHRAAGCAGGPERWGLDAIDPVAVRADPSNRIVPFDAGAVPGAHALPPTVGTEAAERAVRTTASGFAVGPVQMEFLARDLRYLFVPVWVVRLRIDRHPYCFVVEALDGRLLAGRAPEAARRTAAFLLFAGAWIGFPLGKLVATVVARDGAAGVAARVGFEAITSAPVVPLVIGSLLLMPVAWAWGEFRYRGEVVFRPDGVVVEKPARPRETWLDRLVARLNDFVERSVESRE